MALSAEQLKQLKQLPVGPTGNRVAAALEMLDVKQTDAAAAMEFTQPYISDVVRGRHSTITVDNAHKFSDYIGAPIEVLFPSREAVAS